jgi:mRNA interferase RelE/StbE
MGRYSVLIKPSAVREIEAIDEKVHRQRIVARIEALGQDPRPPGCEKLAGREQYRVRQGPYRIVYSIEDERLVVYVVKVGHRSSVYRAP